MPVGTAGYPPAVVSLDLAIAVHVEEPAALQIGICRTGGGGENEDEENENPPHQMRPRSISFAA
jgi:hypothetical protein